MQFVRFDTLDVRNQRFEILSLRSLKVEDPSCNLSKKKKTPLEGKVAQGIR